MADRVMGSWFVIGRYGFLLRRLSRAGMPDLEFADVSGVLSRSDSFNGNGFAFIGEPPWRSTKLHISDGAASSSGVKVIRHFLL